MDIEFEKLINECIFTTARSGGSGGQNVNKVETKVILSLDICNSQTLTDIQKEQITEKLKNRINKEGFLQIVSETERTQFLNKKAVVEKLKLILAKALKTDKKRVPTKPTKQAKEKRLDEKKRVSEKKKLRGGKIDL